MSFIKNELGRVHAAGWFLAHEECVRETRQVTQDMAETDGENKIVLMGTLYTVVTEVEGEDVTDYIGFVYEDVDVTSGNMPASVVTKGVVYEDRLADTLTADAKEALEAKGFTFVTTPTVTRP